MTMRWKTPRRCNSEDGGEYTAGNVVGLGALAVTRVLGCSFCAACKLFFVLMSLGSLWTEAVPIARAQQPTPSGTNTRGAAAPSKGLEANRMPAGEQPVPFWEVRLTMSEAAGALLSSRRFRQYLSIELEEAGHVGVQAAGPLSEHVAVVWIDLPQPDRVLIQARLGGAPVVSRTLRLRSGLRSDVTLRAVAIATAELVRSRGVQAPVKKRKKASMARRLERQRAERNAPAALFSVGMHGGWLPASRAFVAGSSVEVSFRLAQMRQYLTGSWMAGPSSLGPMRWADVGIGAQRALWFTDDWRMDAGLGVHWASVWTRDGVWNADGDRSTWTARATAQLKFENKVAQPLWLGFGIEPGVVLRSVEATGFDGSTGGVKGFFGVASVTLQYEIQSSARHLW